MNFNQHFKAYKINKMRIKLYGHIKQEYLNRYANWMERSFIIMNLIKIVFSQIK